MARSSRLTRRRFLQTSAAVAGATFVIGGTKSSGNVLGSNDRVRVAVAGLNGRGQSHLSGFSRKDKQSEVTFVVDPDRKTHERAVNAVKTAAGNAPIPVTDIRQVLDDPNVDAISIATPNHWHALMTIWACEAGKDVYVEKPNSHNIHEGEIAVQAAAKHGRIVQHGTQSRSGGWAKTIAALKSGKLGKLKVAHGYCYKPRGSIGFRDSSPPPEDLDFNLWLGPASEQPYHGNLVHYNWHWFWETGNGDIGNQGVHQMDIAWWGLTGATWPKRVISLGGRFGYKDQGQTPNTQVAVFDYGDAQVIFEVRGLKAERKVDNAFVTDEGTITHGKFHPKNGGEPQPLPSVDVETRPGGSDHFGNFLAAVRSRKVDDLNAPLHVGRYSSGLCHLANISYRLAQETPFNAGKKTFTDNPAASEVFASMEEHLATENGLSLDGQSYRLGRMLTLDPSKPAFFVGDKDATAMLTRDYRKPFVVPERLA